MARVKYSAIVDSIDGSIGGTTFQKNRYGFTMRRKPNPAKPNSEAQRSSKLSMSTAQQEWIALSDSNRAAWNTYASTFPRAPKHNASATLNGFNYFIFYHLYIIQQTNTFLLNPSGVQRTLTLVETEIVGSMDAITWGSTITSSGGTWIALLYMSRPISLTTYLRPNLLRFIRGFQKTATFSEDVSSFYSAIFGSVPVNGDIVLTREIFLNLTNGQTFIGLLNRTTVAV